MATETPNIHLKRLDPADMVNRTLFNANVDILDMEISALKEGQEDLVELRERQNTLEANQTTMAGRLSTDEINIANLQDTKEDKAKKGQPNGYPSLDANGRIPITQIPPNIKEMRVVADITARNTLTVPDLYDGLRVRVLDASGDPTVTSGWAEYVYDAAGQMWIKVAEKESMDVVLDWGNIQNIPDLLKAFSDLNGKLIYKGNAVYVDVRSVNFIGGDSEIIYDWDGTVQKVLINCADARDSSLDFSIEKQTKADYIAKAGNWQLIGGSQLTLPAGEVYKEFAVTDTINAGDVIRASTVGDDTGVTFKVIIKNN